MQTRTVGHVCVSLKEKGHGENEEKWVSLGIFFKGPIVFQ